MRVPIQELRVGCILSEDVFSLTNRPIICRKTVITKELLDIMKIFLIDEAEVETTMITGKPMSSSENMEEAEAEITRLLRQRHRISGRMENDFTVRNLTALAAVASSTAKIMAWMLGAIASISLFVGGIGIMNIMLVSVTERTREIGIRMAIGASHRAILAQFLLEALMICILGGLTGVVLGIAGAWTISQIADMPVVITLSMIGLAFTFVSIIGIFFGFYPAKKAASLKPVEALRYE